MPSAKPTISMNGNGHTPAAPTPGKAARKVAEKFRYEFGGPVGAFADTIMLPVAVYLLWLVCNSYYHLPFTFQLPTEHQLHTLWHKKFLPDLFSWHAVGVYLSWYALNVVLYYIVPGKVVDGTVVVGSDNKRLKYPINGLLSSAIAVLAVFAAVYLGIIPATYGYDHFLALFTASVIFSYALSFYLFISSHLAVSDSQIDTYDKNSLVERILAPHGTSRNIFYDFWIGRTLNPRILGLDLKFFNELRPGLVLWILMDLSFAAKQYHDYQWVDPSMLMVIAFHFIYVLDALWSEESILTTMDITTDGFGFMLVFGDLAWVPFIYSLQARFLAFHPVKLSLPSIIAITALEGIGYYVFRSSNAQKNTFKTNPNDPSVSKLNSIETKTGSRLLIEGWWGMSRHINYAGDLLMGLSWCLPTGFNTIATYFYIIYFTVLLVHRQRRDDHKCHTKYGKDWDKYCKLVPYRIVPYVY